MTALSCVIIIYLTKELPILFIAHLKPIVALHSSSFKNLRTEGLK